MEEGLIREIRDAEEQAAGIIREADESVERALNEIDGEFSRLREEWKSGYRDLLAESLREAETKAAESAEKRKAELQNRVDRIREHASGAASSARAHLLGLILEGGNGHQ